MEAVSSLFRHFSAAPARQQARNKSYADFRTDKLFRAKPSILSKITTNTPFLSFYGQKGLCAKLRDLRSRRRAADLQRSKEFAFQTQIQTRYLPPFSTVRRLVGWIAREENGESGRTCGARAAVGCGV